MIVVGVVGEDTAETAAAIDCSEVDKPVVVVDTAVAVVVDLDIARIAVVDCYADWTIHRRTHSTGTERSE